MRFDPPGFTGPPTPTDEISWRKGEDRESLSSVSFLHTRRNNCLPVHYFRAVYPSSSISGSRGFRRHFSIRRRRSSTGIGRIKIVSKLRGFRGFYSNTRKQYTGILRIARPYLGAHEDGPEARNATAFRVPRRSISRGDAVRPRTHSLTPILEGEQNRDPQSCRLDDDCDDDHDNHDENQDYVLRTSLLRVSLFDSTAVKRLSSTPQKRIPHSSRGTAHCGNGRSGGFEREDYLAGDTFLQGGYVDHDNPSDSSRISTAATSSIPSVDVLAYTAYNDDENGGNVCDQGTDVRRISLETSAVTREATDRAKKVELPVEREYRARDAFRCNLDATYRDASEEEDDPFHLWSGKRLVETKSIEKEKKNGRSNDNTARFQKPITRRRERSSERCDIEKLAIETNGPRKRLRWCGGRYGLLFILYLLAWPLLCSTNPSEQFTSAFAQKPLLAHAENFTQRNTTSSQFPSFLSSSVVQQQQQQQQQVQQQQNHQQQQQQRYVQTSDHGSDGNGYHGHSQDDKQLDQQQEQQQEQEVEHDQVVQGVPNFDAVHPYNEYSWEVNQINPWLSACDLAGPAPADLQGSCGPPEVSKNCPLPCVSRSRGTGDDTGFHEVIEKLENSEYERPSWSSIRRKMRGKEMVKEETGTEIRESARKSDRAKVEDVQTAPEQCLFYLEESHKRDICRDDFGRASTRSFLTPRENRYWFMSGLRLRHCCEHAVVNALAPGKGGPLEDVLNGGRKCADALDKLLLVNALAARLHCEFEEVLSRYDCAQPYSVIHNCTHCKEAYRKWVCSSLVPYFAHGGPQELLELESSEGSWIGSRLRPCRSFCQSVEQRCPYLLPGDRAPAYPTQYAGEPTFLCRDPNIPETGEHAARALHSSEDDECCFHVCSKEEPGSGLCANCTFTERPKRPKTLDPSTAPHCEITPIQSLPTGEQYPSSSEEDTTGRMIEDDDSSSGFVATSSPSSIVQQQQQGTSLCKSRGMVSLPTTSSSGRSTLSIFPRLLCLCSIMISLFGSVRSTLLSLNPSKLIRLAAKVSAILSGLPLSAHGRVCHQENVLCRLTLCSLILPDRLISKQRCGSCWWLWLWLWLWRRRRRRRRRRWFRWRSKIRRKFDWKWNYRRPPPRDRAPSSRLSIDGGRYASNCLASLKRIRLPSSGHEDHDVRFGRCSSMVVRFALRNSEVLGMHTAKCWCRGWWWWWWRWWWWMLFLCRSRNKCRKRGVEIILECAETEERAAGMFVISYHHPRSRCSSKTCTVDARPRGCGGARWKENPVNFGTITKVGCPSPAMVRLFLITVSSRKDPP